MRRATWRAQVQAACGHRFNSRPSCDGRHIKQLKLQEYAAFQFTPVVRRATYEVLTDGADTPFQFTPVVRRATRKRPRRAAGTRRFNSRPSCDGRQRRRESDGLTQDVSIHARRATGDLSACGARLDPLRFNSRPSCDGRHRRSHLQSRRQVSIHARRATGDRIDTVFSDNEKVSIHARRATGDTPGGGARGHMRKFQFTPVVRRATLYEARLAHAKLVSIHARRATGDSFSA